MLGHSLFAWTSREKGPKGKEKKGRRQEKKELEESFLKSFLKTHGFKDVTTARQGGCLSKRESVYPLHVAASYGDYPLVRLLLARGADPEAWINYLSNSFGSKSWGGINISDMLRRLWALTQCLKMP